MSKPQTFDVTELDYATNEVVGVTGPFESRKDAIEYAREWGIERFERISEDDEEAEMIDNLDTGNSFEILFGENKGLLFQIIPVQEVREQSAR